MCVCVYPNILQPVCGIYGRVPVKFVYGGVDHLLQLAQRLPHHMDVGNLQEYQLCIGIETLALIATIFSLEQENKWEDNVSHVTLLCRSIQVYTQNLYICRSMFTNICISFLQNNNISVQRHMRLKTFLSLFHYLVGVSDTALPRIEYGQLV